MISVIVPIHNQGDFVETVVEDYVEVLQKLGRSFELILIPNGCSDNTVEVCQPLLQRHKECQIVVLEKMGWGASIKKGMQIAKGDLLCYVNSARNTGGDLWAVLSKALSHPETLVQARREVRQNFFRRFGSWSFNLECRLLFGLPFRDINGKPKAFPKSFHKLLELRSDDILFDLELAIVTHRKRYAVVEVPIYSWRRHGGKSTTTLRSALQLYLSPFRFIKRKRAYEQDFRLQKP